MVLKKQKAYTLIELVVILIIIAILAVMAIPAFMNYGKKQALSQKADEIKQLIDQAYLLSRNPENDALSYELFADKTPTPDEFILKKCKTNMQANFRCGPATTDWTEIRKVKLLDGQIVQSATDPVTGDPVDSYISCSSDPSQNCNSTSISVFDSNINGKQTIAYTISQPFSVSYMLKD
jgi:type II secretory pathway pseudopilin PulG